MNQTTSEKAQKLIDIAYSTPKEMDEIAPILAARIVVDTFSENHKAALAPLTKNLLEELAATARYDDRIGEVFVYCLNEVSNYFKELDASGRLWEVNKERSIATFESLESQYSQCVHDAQNMSKLQIEVNVTKINADITKAFSEIPAPRADEIAARLKEQSQKNPVAAKVA